MSLLPKIKDSRGRESHTLFFVTLALLVLIPKFAVSSLTVFGITFPAMTGGEFAAAFGAVLLVWLGREWTEKK
jgi:hypothetical protein